MLAADWVADTQLQLQLSQLSYLDADLHQLEQADSSSELSNKQPSYQEVEPRSQAQPLEISSDSEVSKISDNELSDGEPRRSGHIKKLSTIMCWISATVTPYEYGRSVWMSVRPYE
jgi:hypothetical protein